MTRAKWFVFTLMGCLAVSSFAAEKKEKVEKGLVALEPETAGPDFKVQGEYEGTYAGKKYGCQVVAMSDGTFKAVFEAGGLPGAGWDTKTRSETDGKTDGGTATFTGKDFSITIANDKIAGKTAAGEPIELSKVMRKSPTEGATPPAGAIVLFDGTNTDAFEKGKIDSRKLLGIGATTKQAFSDFKLHIEFIEPFKPKGRGQDRGNSGIYIQRHYEIQVLDSFGRDTQPNDCGSVYTKIPPLVLMSFPPLSWQTYDIDFTASRYDSAGKRAPGHVTVVHNGVVVQNNTELPDHTGAGKPEDPKLPVQNGPIYLQDHGNPVFYRNIWIVEKK